MDGFGFGSGGLVSKTLCRRSGQEEAFYTRITSLVQPDFLKASSGDSHESPPHLPVRGCYSASSSLIGYSTHLNVVGERDFLSCADWMGSSYCESLMLNNHSTGGLDDISIQ